MSCEQNLQIHKYNLLKNLVSFVSDHPELMRYYYFFLRPLSPDLHNILEVSLCKEKILCYFSTQSCITFA